MHNISWIYLHSWKWLASNHSGSTEATCGCGKALQFFYWVDQHVSLLIFCIFLVGASKVVTPPAMGRYMPLTYPPIHTCTHTHSFLRYPQTKY